MALKKKFVETWQKELSIAAASFGSLILVGIEKIMEVEFKCPPKKTLRDWYGVLYFVVPAVVLFVLSVAFQPKCLKRCCHSCRQCCGSSFKIFLPSLIWIVILLLDGRYVACLCETSEENITVDNTAQPSDCYIKSQIAGLGIIFGIVFFFSIYKCLNWCSDGGESHETQDQLEMGDTSTRKQKCMQKLVTDIVEPHVSVCLDKVLAVIEEEGSCARS
ncbi:trypsin [Platysternon megacephalum]|uniref:Trypsin n=1 Tax=Platysternon megacephalum TaxID=55544 RepID=A0A4D9DHQ4_9SAUR|nr:trypsin [Platysternon megacephalum]